MPNISSIGVGSNLPLNELLDKLRKSENIALARIAGQKKVAEARTSAYGQLKGLLEKLAEAGKTLGQAETFNASSVSVNGDAVSASAKSGAMPGHYDISVTQLACSQVLVAQQGQASRSEQIGGEGAGGVISIKVGNQTKTLDLAGKGNSLDDIAKAINNSDLGLQATVVNDGSNTPYRLVLTTKASGTDAAVGEISVSGNDALQSMLGYGGQNDGMAQNVAAQDAHAVINGIPVTSASNKLDDVIDGVSITLNKLTDTPQGLTVTSDDKPTKEAIKKFVEAYNTLQTKIADLTRYDQEKKQGSALTGDSVARTVQSRARGVVDVSVGDNFYANLSRIGISTDPNNGQLKIDEKRLDAALKENSQAVAQLFGSEHGVAARTEAITKPMLEGERGLMATSIDGAKKSVSMLEKDYERTEARIEVTMERYRSQFTALDGMISQMNGISAYLTQQLGMLAINAGSKQ